MCGFIGVRVWACRPGGLVGALCARPHLAHSMLPWFAQGLSHWQTFGLPDVFSYLARYLFLPPIYLPMLVDLGALNARFCSHLFSRSKESPVNRCPVAHYSAMLAELRSVRLAGAHYSRLLAELTHEQERIVDGLRQAGMVVH